MIDFRRSTSKQGAPAADAAGRLGRAVGRLALWTCVLVLLIRGIASVLAGPPGPAKPPAAGVTVTQPTTPVPTMRGRGR